MLISLLGISLPSLFQLNQIGKEIGNISDIQLPMSKVMGEIALMQKKESIQIQIYLRLKDDKFAQEYYQQGNQVIGKFNDLTALLKKNALETDEIFKQIEEVKSAHTTYVQNGTEIIDMVGVGLEGEELDALTDKFTKQESILGKAIDSVAKTLDKNTNTSAQEVKNSDKEAQFIVLIASIFSVIAGTLVWMFAAYITKRRILGTREEIISITKSISEGNLSQQCNIENAPIDFKETLSNINDLIRTFNMPIRSVIATMKQLAQNDLTTRILENYQGEFAALKDDVNHAISNIQQIIQDSTNATLEVSSACASITQSSQTQLDRASSQASSVEEISSTMAEIKHQANLNAQNSSAANTISEQASTAAEQGSQRMSEMSLAMNNINESSQEIVKIIKVIDEIAFQTNLLALNAAVEAARAGSHGKGFAVVAEEVRNLAEKSATAAKETGNIILQSSAKVEEGIKIASLTEETLKDIFDKSLHVSDIIKEISVASEQQTSSITQILDAIKLIEAGTQGNISDVEKSVDEIARLSELSEDLKDEILRFKVNKDYAT